MKATTSGGLATRDAIGGLLYMGAGVLMLSWPFVFLGSALDRIDQPAHPDLWQIWIATAGNVSLAVIVACRALVAGYRMLRGATACSADG